MMAIYFSGLFVYCLSPRLFIATSYCDFNNSVSDSVTSLILIKFDVQFSMILTTKWTAECAWAHDLLI